MSEFLAAITGVFKFWDQVVWFVKLIQKTPQERRQDLMKSIQKESEKFAESGRPVWD